jgi:hypothetical protein
MKAKTFISLMLLLMVFTAGLFVFAAPAQKEAQKNACPASIDCASETQEQAAADGMIWESVSRHLLNVVQ